HPPYPHSFPTRRSSDLAITPQGVITGFGFGSASTHDQRLAETFFAARAQPTADLLSVGSRAAGVYVADKGFAGDEPHTQWRELRSEEHTSELQSLRQLV